MLLVWAKGMVFAKINGLPLVTSSWWGLHWGALMRRETKTRLYLGYFKETSLGEKWFMKLQLLFYKIIREPEISALPEDTGQRTIFLFNKVITNEDLFGELRDHQEMIAHELYGMLTSRMRSQLKSYSAPVIGVHIRRGDFKLGNQTTPLEYFINAIKLIRQTRNENLPVTIFTDADHSEISKILELPDIIIAEEKPDILDILLLSKSKIMVLSKGSTFGYWAAFLSGALVIRPHYDWQEKIKVTEAGGIYREVKWNHNDEVSNWLLKEEIKKACLINQ